VHRLVDDRRARAFSDGVPDPQDPSAPRIIASQYRCGSQRNERVYERKLVLELPHVREAFTHHRDRLVWLPAPNRQDGPDVQSQVQEPRTRVSKRGRCLIDQALRFVRVARCQSDRAIPASAFPLAHGIASEIAKLDQLGIVYVHVVEASEDDIRHGGSMVPTDRLRPLFRRTLIVNGGYDRERADAVIRSGVANLVSFGNAFLANPDLPQRLKIGAALNAPDLDTFYGGGEKGYVDYPARCNPE